MKIKIKEMSFYLALIFFGIQYVIGTSNLETFLKISVNTLCSFFKILSFLLIFLKVIIFTKYNKNELLFSIFFLIMSTIVYCFSKSDYIFIISFFVVGSKGIKFKNICKIVLFTYIPVIFIIMLMSIVGVVDNSVISQGTNILTGERISRNSLGFQHVNFLGGYILLLYISFIYLKKDSYSWIIYIFSLFLVFILLTYISTKTSALIIFIISTILMFEKIIGEKLNKTVVTSVCGIIMLISIFISFFLAITYNENNSVYVILDKILSKRISYGNDFLNEYTPTLFGQELKIVSSIQEIETGEEAMILDNAYLYLYLRYGIVEFLIILGTYIYIYFKYRKDIFITTILCAIFICAISEKWLFMLGYNTILLLLFAENDSNKEERIKLK